MQGAEHRRMNDTDLQPQLLAYDTAVACMPCQPEVGDSIRACFVQSVHLLCISKFCQFDHASCKFCLIVLQIQLSSLLCLIHCLAAITTYQLRCCVLL
jgi:hypothetical protein